MTTQLERFHQAEPLSARKKNKQIDKFNEVAGLGVRPPTQVFSQPVTVAKLATVDITGFWAVRKYEAGGIGPIVLSAIDPATGRGSTSQRMTLGDPDLISVGGSVDRVFVLDVITVLGEDIPGYSVLDAVTFEPIGDRVELSDLADKWVSIDGDSSTVLVARGVAVLVNGEQFTPRVGTVGITGIRGISGDAATAWLVKSNKLYLMRTSDMRWLADIAIDDETVRSATKPDQRFPNYTVLDISGKGSKCSVLMRLNFSGILVEGQRIHYYLFHHEIVDGDIVVTGHTYLGSKNLYLSIGGGK